jgi:hypothetical protein
MKIKAKKKEKTVDSGYSFVTKFPEIERPAFIDTLKFPADRLVQMTAEQVSEYHGKFTLLIAYAKQEATKVNIELIKLDAEEARLRGKMLTETPSMNTIDKWKRDALIEHDTRMMAHRQKVSFKQMERAYADTIIFNSEKFLYALSRELTRKMGDRTTGF